MLLLQVVGNSQCPIVDTWWQTETGSHLITPLPGATPLKPGSATLPFFGVEPAVLNEKGEELEGEAEGSALPTHLVYAECMSSNMHNATCSSLRCMPGTQVFAVADVGRWVGGE